MWCGEVGTVGDASLQIDVAVNIADFTKYLHTWPGIIASAMAEIEKAVIRHKHQLSRLVRSFVGLEFLVRNAEIIGVLHITCYFA